MNKIYNDVKQWMEKQIGSSEMLNELSVEAIYVLEEVRKFNCYQNKMLIIQKNLLITQKQEYLKEDMLMHANLTETGFSIDSLDNSTYKTINEIVQTCKLLEINDTSDVCILLAIQHLRIHTNDLCSRVTAKNPMLHNNKQLLLHSRSIAKSLHNFQDLGIPQFRQFNANNFYDDKIHQYGESCRKLIAKTVEISECDHEDNIMKLFKKNDVLTDEVSKFTAKFKYVDEIPPNIDLAILKVNEMKDKLSKIEVLLVNRMDEVRR